MPTTPVGVFIYDSVGDFTSQWAEDYVTMGEPDEVDVLVVAGGGGGGAAGSTGGGGGAGGLRWELGVSVTGSETVTVGDGGDGAPTTGVGDNGDNSVFGSITALGGGGGGGSANDGLAGGSGGGAGRDGQPGAGTEGQGNDGGLGAGSGTSHNASGGGGGAGDVGESAPTDVKGGDGGDGVDMSEHFGAEVGDEGWFSGGGGGGVRSGTDVGIGGQGGGGNGSHNALAATAGAPGTGGGGGGSSEELRFGGKGGHGIIIVRPAAQPMELALEENEALGFAPVRSLTLGLAESTEEATETGSLQHHAVVLGLAEEGASATPLSSGLAPFWWAFYDQTTPGFKPSRQKHRPVVFIDRDDGTAYVIVRNSLGLLELRELEPTRHEEVFAPFHEPVMMVGKKPIRVFVEAEELRFEEYPHNVRSRPILFGNKERTRSRDKRYILTLPDTAV